ncbi:MAG: SH3 domain-containing protein [Chloroflexi bacterium]|nr:SH3 domain-containing protein [Chloroflexota bacterium]
MANVIGPDVSFYQDDPETPQGIDFVKMRKSAGYVIIRAGQNTWVDSDFKINWREAKLAKLPRGSYWFYDSRTEPKKQAELWVSLFGGDFGELPLFADFEENYKGPYKGWKNWYTFLERLKSLVGGHEIAIYTAYYYWRDNAPNAETQSASLNYFKQYPLWIARYQATEPLVPAPWKKEEWLFWQYTEVGDGKLYGVESKGIDLNYFNGDMTAFAARFNLTIPDPDPDPDPDPEDKPTGIDYRVTAQPSLKVREGPGTTYNSIGLLYPDEIVEEINANSDRTWLKVRKSDGSLIGWCSVMYLEKVDETPVPTVKLYKVTASPSLKAREGPGLTYNSLGTFPYGTIVQELAANVDRTWLKVKNSAGTLTGWSFVEYLEYVGETPVPPDDEEGKLYRVTTTTLQVLESPAATAKLVGLVYFGEIVESLDASADGLWLKIKKSDGSIVGWSLKKDLLLVDDTPPPDDDEATPVPDDDDKKWYRVTVASVPVRETASASAKTLGTVVQDDTLPALDDTTNAGWIQLRRVDGLTGWCEKKYLALLSVVRPTSIKQNLFRGVTFLQKDLVAPRKNRVYVLAVDLTTSGLEFLVTPSKISGGILCSQTTSKFLEAYSLGAAINGDGYSYLDASAYPPSTVCSSGGDPVKVNGYAASRGTVYSPTKTVQPTVYISSKNQVTIDEKPNKPFNAVSGDRMVVKNGATVSNLAALAPAPRTAIGLNRNGRWFILLVVDGRQSGYSEGLTLSELGDLLRTYGVYTGVNMDGGGSSAMIIKGIDGEARILNSPIDQNIPGKERSVANHLGLYVK